MAEETIPNAGGLVRFAMAGDMLMKKPAEVLYKNLQFLALNFETWRTSPGGANTDKVKIGLATRAITEVLDAYSPSRRSRDAYETRIKSITDVFRNMTDWFPGQMDILFLGYKPGERPFENSYAPDTNVRDFCLRTEPKILGAIGKR